MSNDASVEQLDVKYEDDTGFICVAYAPGRLEEADARKVTEITSRYVSDFTSQGDPTFILVDVRRVTGISPEARKAFAQGDQSSGHGTSRSHIAVFGGSFAFRALANILMKALTLVSDKMIATVEVDEAAARAWLMEHRQAHLARKSK